MENAALAARVNQTALTMAQHTSFARLQNSSIDYYLPPCVAQTLRQRVCGAMVVAHGVYFYVGADLCDAGLSQGAVALEAEHHQNVYNQQAAFGICPKN